VPVAYVVWKEGPWKETPADAAALASSLDARCREKLASFKIPRGFLAVDSLPRTALGKVQKRLLPPWKP